MRFVARAGFACALAVGWVGVSHATPVTIIDYAGDPSSYWGGNPPSGYKDVVSNSPTDTNSLFEIKKAVVDVSYAGASTALIIDIYTNYNPNSPNAFQTKYGDLFLTPTSSYAPYATGGSPAPHYAADRLSTTGTVWDYALVLGDQKVAVGPTGTSLTAYAIGGNSNITPSYITVSGGFRQNQPVEYNKGTGPGLTTGSLTVSNTGDPGGVASDVGLYQLRFIIDNLAALSALGSDAAGYSFGLLWAMTCANDVIAGTASFAGRPPGVPPPSAVPLPGALPLLIVALGSLGVGFRRRFTSKA